MIGQELETSLHMAFVEARQARHESMTVEHLLLALLDNPSAAEVLSACDCDIEDLRKSLQNFVSDNTPVLPQSSEAEMQPTLGFQRVIQRAIMHVQSTSNRMNEVTGADVLVALFGEKDSRAVSYLHQHGVRRLDVVKHMPRGITKAPLRKAIIGQELEVSLQKALVEARQARHEFVTVEHLLLALLDNPSAAEVLSACARNIEDLRKSLQNFVSDNTPVLPQSSEADTQPTLGYQRVLQRAIMHVQSTSNGMNEVTGANVLAALFGEKDSHAVYYLHQQGVTLSQVAREGSEGVVQAPFAVHDGGSMIAQELEVSLHMAFVEARQARHEFISVEHLLLALLDNPSAVEVLRTCGCNIEDLRKSLQTFVWDKTPVLPQTSEADTQPTLGFQRVIQRAIMHAQSTSGGKKEVTGGHVLVALFGERDSHAVNYLHQQGVTRLDVVNCISHGITKTGHEQETTGQQDEAPGLNPEELVAVLDDLLAQARDGRIHPLVGRAISEARAARHRFVKVEHLLLGVLEDASAVQMLRSWGCDVESLQKALVDSVSAKVPALPEDSATGTRPSAGFARVIERATMRAFVRGLAAPVVDGQACQAGVSDVLKAILDEERASPAVTLFRRYTRNLNLLGSAGTPRAGGPA